MSVMVGGTGIIGQDMVCGFGKKNEIIWEKGFIHDKTGEDESRENTIRTGFYKLKNTTTKCDIYWSPKGVFAKIYEYDKNKKYLGCIFGKKGNLTKTLESKGGYVRFVFHGYSSELESFMVKEVS